MNLSPSPDWRYAFKKGMKGTDVAALQINLEATEVDSIFGPLTEASVRAFQVLAGLEPIDGIAGPATQQSMVLRRSSAATKAHELPKGLLRSIVAGESSFFVAAYSKHPSDTGFDLGAYQDSITPSDIGNQAAYRNAYDVSYMAENTAAKIRRQHDAFLRSSYVHTDRKAWELALLFHNNQYWPTHWANYGTYAEDESALVTISRDPLIQYTVKDWCERYIQRASIYIRWP